MTVSCCAKVRRVSKPDHCIGNDPRRVSRRTKSQPGDEVPKFGNDRTIKSCLQPRRAPSDKPLSARNIAYVQKGKMTREPAAQKVDIAYKKARNFLPDFKLELARSSACFVLIVPSTFKLKIQFVELVVQFVDGVDSRHQICFARFGFKIKAP